MPAKSRFFSCFFLCFSIKICIFAMQRNAGMQRVPLKSRQKALNSETPGSQSGGFAFIPARPGPGVYFLKLNF
jgi:hypothetical protein